NVVARHRISAIYAGGEYTAVGGLMQYHRDPLEAYRQVPYYIDRVFRGTKPGDLPVQMPTKFKLSVNRKTAAALGIDVPLGLLLAAGGVIKGGPPGPAAPSSPSSAARLRGRYR